MSTPETDQSLISPPPNPAARSDLPRSLLYFLYSSLTLTNLALLFALVARRMGLGLPYSFPGLFAPRSFLGDFLEFWDRISLLGTPQFFSVDRSFMYPPGMVLPIAAVYALPHRFRNICLLFLLSGCFFAFCFFRIVRNRGLALWPGLVLTAGVAITSYPYRFVFERGNTEVFLWIAVSLGIWSFYRAHHAWAAVCFGLATGLKLYPFIFFGLFLPRRLYREIALGVLTTVAITLAGLRALSPNLAFALHWDMAQLRGFGKNYSAFPLWLGFDHSFFGLLKFAALHWRADMTPFLRPYLWTAAIACLVLYFWRIWRLPFVNQVVILSVLSVTIPQTSYDYTLTSLYPSFALLSIAALRLPEEKQRLVIPYFLLFALILTPETYIVIHGAQFGAQVRSLCLLIMLILALSKPLPVEALGPQAPA